MFTCNYRSCTIIIVRMLTLRAFLAKLRYFFPGAPIWSLLFSFELWAKLKLPLRLPWARSRETARSPFSDTVFTMKTLFYSNHCKLCIKYKSLTAIPDFEDDDILFIYEAMACYKKRVTWLLMLVDERFFF